MALRSEAKIVSPQHGIDFSYLEEAMTPMRAVALRKPFDRLLGKIPDDVMSVPSMMSTLERRFLFGVAHQFYSGQGAIIDAGIFLGASTRCFGEGVMANPAVRGSRGGEKPITSFERGIVNPGMPPFFKRNGVEFNGKPGDDFSELLRKNVAPVESVVDLRVGDILQSTGFPDKIEVLYLDVLKSAEITFFCFQNFFPKLIPNVSLVLQQDYFFDGLPFIKTYQEHFASCFEYVGEIASMAVFKCIAPVERLEKPLEQQLDAESQLRLSSIALQRSIDSARRFMMAVSKLRLIKSLQGPAEAGLYLDHIRSEFPVEVEMAQRSGRLKEIWTAALKLASVESEV